MSTTVVDKEFRQRLRLIMQQFGSVADLAQAVEVSDNAIYKWVSGRGQPSIVSLVNLAKAAGVSVEWLVTGRGPRAKTKGDSQPMVEAQEFVSMPRHAVRIAGSRAPVQSSQIVDHVKFRMDWVVRTLNAQPKNLALIEAVGDSMTPTVSEGDLVLVDLHEARFKHDGLYVLRSENALSVKRVQRQPDGSLAVRSDNPAYEPIIVSADSITLLGRVLWLGRHL